MKCSFVSLLGGAVALLAFSLAASSAVAGQQVFFARDDSTTGTTSYPNSLAEFNAFTAVLTSYGVDDLENPPGFDFAPVLVFGGTGITAATQGVVALSAPGLQIGGRGLAEYDAAIDPSPGGQVNTAFFLSEPVTAFGMFVTQGGDNANDNPTIFRLTGPGGTKDVNVQIGDGWGDDNIFFIGIADTDPFDTVELIETGDILDGMLYDNVIVGTYVPEPSTLALAALGTASAVGLGLRRRLRKR